MIDSTAVMTRCAFLNVKSIFVYNRFRITRILGPIDITKLDYTTRDAAKMTFHLPPANASPSQDFIRFAKLNIYARSITPISKIIFNSP